MFTINEINQLKVSYFSIIRQTERYFEIMSESTGHCWIVQKLGVTGIYPVSIHHKHRLKDPYYHKHRYVYTVAMAIKEIQNHDDYVVKSSSFLKQTAN